MALKLQDKTSYFNDLSFHILEGVFWSFDWDKVTGIVFVLKCVYLREALVFVA